MNSWLEVNRIYKHYRMRNMVWGVFFRKPLKEKKLLLFASLLLMAFAIITMFNANNSYWAAASFFSTFLWLSALYRAERCTFKGFESKCPEGAQLYRYRYQYIRYRLFRFKLLTSTLGTVEQVEDALRFLRLDRDTAESRVGDVGVGSLLIVSLLVAIVSGAVSSLPAQVTIVLGFLLAGVLAFKMMLDGLLMPFGARLNELERFLFWYIEERKNTQYSANHEFEVGCNDYSIA